MSGVEALWELVVVAGFRLRLRSSDRLRPHGRWRTLQVPVYG